VTECFKLPLVPVRVIVYVPVGVVLLVATLKVDVAEPPDGTLTGLGEKLQVLLGGQPVALSMTLPLKVFRDFRVSVYFAVPPRLIEVEVGLLAIEKSGMITTSETDVV
jgi:hypothetical protein